MKKSVRKFCSMAVSFWAGISLCFTTFAQELKLPVPTQMVNLSPAQSQPLLRGVKINPDNPLQIEFIVDKQHEKSVSKEDIKRLVSYFMAALAIPEEELWVNLSPYEQERIIPNELGQTAFGEGLLAQDYFLKQLASSLTYPESTTGKNYWQMALSGQQKVVNTFNKIWIVPQAAEIYENGNTALITKAKLKVMSEEDYLATQKNQDVINSVSTSDNSVKALKRVIIPQIEKEVNSGENFSELRQIFCSYMLAKWFKNKLKDSLYKYYIDQKKIKGIDLADKTIKEKIYNQYVEAFKKGVYNYIKKDYNSSAHKITKRQYFSGGIVVGTQLSLSHDPETAARQILDGGPFPGRRAAASDNSGSSIFVRRMPSDARGANILPLALTLTLGGALVGVTTQVGCGTGKASFYGDGGTSGDASAMVSSEAGGSKSSVDGGSSSSDDTAVAGSKPEVAAASSSPDVASAGVLVSEAGSKGVDGGLPSPDDASVAGSKPEVAPASSSPDAASAASGLDVASAGGIGDAPTGNGDGLKATATPFQPSAGNLAATDKYLSIMSDLVTYLSGLSIKPGSLGYPNEGLTKLVDVLVNTGKTAANGSDYADVFRILGSQSAYALAYTNVTGQFDLLYLSSIAWELGKAPADVLTGLNDRMSQLAGWKGTAAAAGYVSDPAKEKMIYRIALQAGLAISDLFAKYPLLLSDPDYPYALWVALQLPAGKFPATLQADYAATKTQLGSQATSSNVMAKLSAQYNGGVDPSSSYAALSGYFNDRNISSGGKAPANDFDYSSTLAITGAGDKFIPVTDGGGTNMTDIDTAEERAEIAHSQAVLDAKAEWRRALRKKELPVSRAEVTLRLPGHDPEKISVSVAYVEDMPKGLRGTVVDGVVILPSEQALEERSGRMLKKAGLTAREVLDDRLKHEAFEPRLGSHTVTWLAQEYEYGGALTPEQRLQMAEHEGDAVWKARMQAEASTGRGGHEAAIKRALGDTAEVERLIAANKKHYGGVNLKAEIKTQGNSKAIAFKLSPAVVEQFKKNGLRFEIVKFGYGVNLQEFFNGR